MGRKRRRVEENYDLPAAPEATVEEEMEDYLQRQDKGDNTDDDDGGNAEFEPQHLGLPLHMRKQQKRLIVILEGAQLETVKRGKFFDLLNNDDHLNMMKIMKRKPANSRPDIAHQCLLMLLDSPLNRAGLLQVYIHTERNVLIEVNPQTRIPRTYKRFAGVMVQLLHKFSIRSSEGSIKLFKVIKNPISDHLPVGCRKIGTSVAAEKLVRPQEIISADDPEKPIAIVIGAFAHGKVVTDYVEEEVSISKFPLSAALACAKFCSSFEEAWNVH